MVMVKDIFASIQGEGPLVGYKQLFVRLCSCNLHCDYCDTEFDISSSKEYSIEYLLDIVNHNIDCHSISFTGGEPLLSIEFLKKFLPKSPLPVYLETNGTLYENLSEVIKYVDYVASDIKLPSCTGLKPLWKSHDKFFEIASNKYLFAKLVFDVNITNEEIEHAANLCKKYNVELVLQPKMLGNVPAIDHDFMFDITNKFLQRYKNVRLIPQVHKFLNIE